MSISYLNCIRHVLKNIKIKFKIHTNTYHIYVERMSYSKCVGHNKLIVNDVLVLPRKSLMG